jgi:hypothetical protein
MSMKDQTERWLLAACTLVLLLALMVCMNAGPPATTVPARDAPAPAVTSAAQMPVTSAPQAPRTPGGPATVTSVRSAW